MSVFEFTLDFVIQSLLGIGNRLLQLSNDLGNEFFNLLKQGSEL